MCEFFGKERKSAAMVCNGKNLYFFHARRRRGVRIYLFSDKYPRRRFALFTSLKYFYLFKFSFLFWLYQSYVLKIICIKSVCFHIITFIVRSIA